MRYRQVAAKHFRQQIDKAYDESEDPSFNVKDEKAKSKL
jgi:hypothetical protein